MFIPGKGFTGPKVRRDIGNAVPIGAVLNALIPVPNNAVFKDLEP
jgi:hypothetical protein